MAPEGKIKSKDLTYEATLPPFLQRLHARKAGAGDPDRHERQIARPKRAPANDEDDAPTVVDESGETLTKEEFEKLADGNNADGTPELADLVRGRTVGDGEPLASGAIQDEDVAERKGEQKVTDGTTTKKRKIAKVVGDKDNDASGQPADDKDDHEKPGKMAKKTKKKAKPIRLAFDTEDDPDAT